MERFDAIFFAGIFGSIVIGVILTLLSVQTPSTGTFVQAIEFVKYVIQLIGYLGIFVLAILEIIYPPIPGELVLPFVGFLVAEGKMNPFIAVLVATVGNVIGMTIIYVLSMILGRPFIERYGKYLLMDKRHLEMAEEWFDKYGDITVLFGRMIPAYREIVSVPAGLGKMNLSRFLIFTFIGGFIWDTFLVGLGYIFGENYIIVKAWFDQLDIFIWASIILFVIWFIWKGRRRPSQSIE